MKDLEQFYKEIKDSLNNKFKLDDKITESLIDYFDKKGMISFDNLNDIINNTQTTKEILNCLFINNYIHQLYNIQCNTCNKPIEIRYNNEYPTTSKDTSKCAECYKTKIPENTEPIYKVNFGRS